MHLNFLKPLSVILLLSLWLENGNCELSSLSWYFRGEAQQNNTVLTFNMFDTLNLLCKGTAGADGMYYVTFVIHKGEAPKGMAGTATYPSVLQISGGGTLVYSDETGPQAGFENILIATPGASQYFVIHGGAIYGFRVMNIGALRTADSGTYHCSGMYKEGGTDAGKFMTSGGLTITVNTKAGQARSSRADFNNILSYSAAFLGASTLLF